MLAELDSWLHAHLYAVVFLGSVVDAAGIPFRGRIMLVTVGSISSPGSGNGASPWILIGLATLGTVAGDHAWYLLGRLKGQRLSELYARLFRVWRPRVEAANRLLTRFGILVPVVTRPAVALRAVVLPLAVSRGMSYGQFVAFDCLGGLLWNTGFVWLGRTAGILGSESGLVGPLATVGVLATASTAITLIARRHPTGRAGTS